MSRFSQGGDRLDPLRRRLCAAVKSDNCLTLIDDVITASSCTAAQRAVLGQRPAARTSQRRLAVDAAEARRRRADAGLPPAAVMTTVNGAGGGHDVDIAEHCRTSHDARDNVSSAGNVQVSNSHTYTVSQKTYTTQKVVALLLTL